MTTESIDETLEKLETTEIYSIHRIQTFLLKEMHNFMYEHNFVQLMPILISPITDPLNHQVRPATIHHYDKKLHLTASMIFHKQLSLIPNDINNIYIVSPNIRLELPELRNSKNHLLEFSQFDIEIKDKDMWEIISLVENLLSTSINRTREACKNEFRHLGRELPELKPPFPIYSSDELLVKHGTTFESEMSRKSTTPFFITNFKREFYDKEDQVNPGTYRNFDLIYPEGFGEALSGAEREYDYDRIIKRMNELNMNLDTFNHYLEISRRKKLPRTAGCGIGIQRLVRYLCGREKISDVCIFNRSIDSDFIF
jgi:asparaginyl-tRNA synthetase